jgi:hypothetical protein
VLVTGATVLVAVLVTGATALVAVLVTGATVLVAVLVTGAAVFVTADVTALVTLEVAVLAAVVAGATALVAVLVGADAALVVAVLVVAAAALVVAAAVLVVAATVLFATLVAVVAAEVADGTLSVDPVAIALAANTMLRPVAITARRRPRRKRRWSTRICSTRAHAICNSGSSRNLSFRLGPSRFGGRVRARSAGPRNTLKRAQANGVRGSRRGSGRTKIGGDKDPGFVSWPTSGRRQTASCSTPKMVA